MNGGILLPGTAASTDVAQGKTFSSGAGLGVVGTERVIGYRNPGAGSQAFMASSLGSAGGNVGNGMAIGADGNLWYADPSINSIVLFNITTGTFTAYSVPTGSALSGYNGLYQAVLGPDGNVWFCESGYSTNPRILKITTAGTITEYTQGAYSGNARAICTDGTNLYVGIGQYLTLVEFNIGTLSWGTPGTQNSGGQNIWGMCYSSADSSIYFGNESSTAALWKAPVSALGTQTDLSGSISLASAVCKGSDGSIYMIGNGELVKCTVPGNVVTTPIGIGGLAGLGPGFVGSGTDGNLWVAYNTQITRIVLGAWTSTQWKVPLTSITGACVDPNTGNLWVAGYIDNTSPAWVANVVGCIAT